MDRRRGGVRKLTATEQVVVYALRDLEGANGQVVHRAGQAVQTFPVSAREMVKTGSYGYEPPAGAQVVPPVAPRGTAGDGETDTGEAPFNLRDVPGVPKEVIGALEAAGFGDLEKLLAAEAEDLTKVKGVGTKYAQSVLDYVHEEYGEADDEDDEGGA